MGNYTSEANIELIYGWAIEAAASATSRPTTEQLAEMLNQADAIINAEARTTSNLTDTSGRLETIAVSLVMKMIINMFAFTNPDAGYEFTEVELTDDQKRIIHMEHSIWDSLTWELD